MRIVPDLLERLRALLFRSREDQELDQELRFHLAMQVEENIRRGMDSAEARRQAHLALGGMEQAKEDVRQARGVQPLHDLARDARYGLRRLIQEPGFSVPVILTLALGIGATTAMFSVIDATLLRPLPFEEDARLVALDHVDIPLRLRDGTSPPQSVPYLADLDSLHDVFAGAAMYASGNLNLESGGEPRRIAVALVTPSFFSTLGVQPSIGRPFTAAEGTPETARAAILSNGLWRDQFGGDPQVVGRTLTLNGIDYRIVGVMPPAFVFPGETELWLPLPVPITFDYFEPFGEYLPSQVIARLSPGATLEQAGARLLALARAYRPPDRPVEATASELVGPLRSHLVRQRRTALLVLMGATALILLAACANAAHLLLARAARRRRELALRTVLGATPGRMLRQLLLESVLVALAGGSIGVALAYLGTDALHALIPTSLAGVAMPRVDLRVLAFALGIAVASGLAFGIWPALRARAAHAGDAMRSGHATGATAPEATRLRRLFVISEIALALVLLVGAGVMLRSFQAVLTTDPGLDAQRVATLELSLADARYGASAERRQFYNAVLERLRSMPDVEAAAIVNHLPLSGESSISLRVRADGQSAVRGEGQWARYLIVSPDYFRTLGIPMLRGRAPVSSPDSAAPNEVAISHELARRLWPEENPVGRQLLGPGAGPGGELSRVVGVVGDVRMTPLDEEDLTAQMYYPLGDPSPLDIAVLASGSLPPRVLAARLREAVHAVDPSQPVYNVRSMERAIANAIAPRRTTTLLVSLFGALAVVLAAVGTYGVISFGVARRRPELGIRIALGARPTNVVRLVIREGVLLASVGAGIGVAAAWALSRVLESLVYQVSARDPLTFAAAPILLVGIAALAALIPARRAARVDPLESIRVE